MDEKNAELLRSRSRAAFDAQAPTYDTGTCLYSFVNRVLRAISA